MWFSRGLTPGVVGTIVPCCVRRYSAPMYVDLTRTEVTKTPEGEAEEKEEKYEKVFLAKARNTRRRSMLPAFGIRMHACMQHSLYSVLNIPWFGMPCCAGTHHAALAFLLPERAHRQGADRAWGGSVRLGAPNT
eukprot:366417-Chlamydomonas_euryale.AAC.2